MRLTRFALLVMGASALSCGGDDGGSHDKVAACPELAGDWTIADHCNAALKGMTVPITQESCTVSTGGFYAGLSGPVDSKGNVHLTGTIGGTALDCHGTAKGDQITEDCSGCKATLTR